MRDAASVRITGKPFVAGKFNLCASSMYRSEIGPAMEAFASLTEKPVLFVYHLLMKEVLHPLA
jgi:hypothetical protein